MTPARFINTYAEAIMHRTKILRVDDPTKLRNAWHEMQKCYYAAKDYVIADAFGRGSPHLFRTAGFNYRMAQAKAREALLQLTPLERSDLEACFEDPTEMLR